MAVRQRGRALARIAEVSLTGSQATIDFQNIPAGYKHLLIEASVRSDNNAANDSVDMKLNNDATNANYDRQQHQGAGAGTSAAESLAAAAARTVGVCPAATSPANHFGGLEVVVFDYTANKFKVSSVRSRAWTARSTGTLITREVAQGWASVAVVNRVTLLPTVGANWVAGSIATLYGLVGLS